MAGKVLMALTRGFASVAVAYGELSFIYRWCQTVSWARIHKSTAEYRLSPSIWCVRAQEHHSQRDVSPDPAYDRISMREKLWREFFSDPSQWWDHRPEKVNPRYPDFKHKKRQQGLWIIDNLTPPWVEAELATMAPGLLQSQNVSQNAAWNVRLRRHLKTRDYQKTLDLFEQMQREGIIPDRFTFVAVLNACSRLRSLDKGRRVHEQIIQGGCESEIYVASCLIDMYAKCGNIDEAWGVFNKMRERDVVSWNAMIGGYVKAEQGLKALELFRKMQQEGEEPNSVTFMAVLKACASVAALEEGRRVHEQIIQSGHQPDVYVASCLVDMYAKCGNLDDAWSVFNNMRERDVVSWSTMIVAYVKFERGLKALELFRKMQQEGVEPDVVSFVGALNACASIAALEEGRHVHEQIIRRGFESDVYIATCLVDMYAKCGSTADARTVFNKMRKRDVISWNAMIGGYVTSEEGTKALELFRIMPQEGMEPNMGTFVGALNACASMAVLEEGRRVHEQIIRRGCESDVYVATCLVDMYAKCGSIKDAWSVFNKMRERDVVSWGAMIVGYVKSEQAEKALELFQKMQQEGLEPNTVTFVGVLNACASLAALEEGRRVHEQIIRNGFESDVRVANCLVDMYAKCGSIDDSWTLFNRMRERTVVSWNVLIGGYVKSQQGLKALELFGKMQQEGVEPDVVTFVGALNACSSTAALEEGRRVHKQIISRGLESDVYITNCLVDMYAKCGDIEAAESVFNRMSERSVVSWNVMIGAYVKSEQGLKALGLFQKMQQEGVEPDAVTFVGALNACASVVPLQEGRRLHRQIIDRGCESDVYVATCLIDMYSKCGSTKNARSVFNKMRERTVVSWNAMIGGYAMHGHFKKAIELFEQMGKEGVDVNQVTFTCLLSACSHGGLVEEGLCYFKTMTSHYDVLPTREHYGCMVDLLGRAGRLEEAEEKAQEVSERMPMERDSSIWRSLLGACRIHGNTEIAERAAKQCWELDPENASAHVLLSNIYAAASKWDRAGAIDQEVLKRDIRKVPGRTWIEVNSVVHSFIVDDKDHPQLQRIHAELDGLSVKVNKEGYITDMRFLSPEATEECHLCCLDEKLAIAYGLISTPLDTPLFSREDLLNVMV